MYATKGVRPMKSMTTTKWIILLSVVGWIIWDFWAYFHGGNPSTISATLVRWQWYYPWEPFLVGVLVGHILFDLREPIDWPVDHTATTAKDAKACKPEKL